ncbi:MAG: VOC family protein [Proteobacteria bacterium]|nr:VOC family protein [Pseudomonadota bacterium]
MLTETRDPIRQIAWIVADLDASVRSWHRATGVAPWTCFRRVVLAGEHRGAPATVRMHVALGYLADMEIELIQDVSQGASPYRDPAGAPLLGMHHVAWFSDDFAADVARARARGLRQVFAAANPVTEVAYFEDAHEPGRLFEFISMTAPMREGLAQRLAAAREWRGGEISHTVDLGGW